MSDQYTKPLNNQNQFTAQNNSTSEQNLNVNYQAPPINNQNFPINPIPNQAGVNNNYQNVTQGYNYQPNYQYYNGPNPNSNVPQANYQAQYQQQYGPPQNILLYKSSNVGFNRTKKIICLIFVVIIAIFGIAAIMLSIVL